VTEARTTASSDPTAEAVAAAIGQLTHDGGGVTPADVAAAAGLAYSTTTKKLRALRDAGRAEPFDSENNRTLWRLPTASRATAVSASKAAAVEPEPAIEPTGDTAQAFGGDSAATAPPAAVEQPAADTIAAVNPAAASTPADVTGPDDVEPDGQPGDAEPDDVRADPSAAVDADTTNAARVDDADQAAQPAARPATRPRRATPAPADGDRDVPAATLRRPACSLRGAILDILEADPAGQYKVGQLCKLIDKASEGTGYAKASQGAVYNEAIKLVGAHRAVQTVDKPATFQLAVRPPPADPRRRQPGGGRRSWRFTPAPGAPSQSRSRPSVSHPDRGGQRPCRRADRRRPHRRARSGVAGPQPPRPPHRPSPTQSRPAHRPAQPAALPDPPRRRAARRRGGRGGDGRP
jgi:hypothetical protein